MKSHEDVWTFHENFSRPLSLRTEINPCLAWLKPLLRFLNPKHRSFHKNESRNASEAQFYLVLGVNFGRKTALNIYLSTFTTQKMGKFWMKVDRNNHKSTGTKKLQKKQRVKVRNLKLKKSSIMDQKTKIKQICRIKMKPNVPKISSQYFQ